MKKFTFSGKSLFPLILIALSSTAFSQGTPFVCDGKFFISHGNNNSSTSQTLVEQVTFPSPGVVTVVNFPINSSTTGFNGIGMNPANGYMYGFRYPTTTARTRLVQIGNGSPTNIITDLGEVSTPGTGSDLNNGEYVYAASFRKDGLLYFVTNTNELYSMPSSELAAGAGNREATHIANLNGTGNNAPPSLGMADLGVDPTNGDIYAVSTNTGTNPTALFRINPATGALTRVGIYAAPAGDFIAGLFFTENGTLYGYRSDGSFQLFNKNTAEFTLVGNPPVYNFADGCSCVFRIAHDLNAPLELCPTAINPQPSFNFTITVTNNYQAVTGATFSLRLDNRYSFTQSIATVQASFATAGLTSTGGSITSTGGGTNNLLQVTGISIPYVYPAAIPNILVGARLTNSTSPLVPAKFQSQFGGLPVSLGTLDVSNDPKTSPPDDSTTITQCPEIILPVKLLNFAGVYKNNVAILFWEAENQTSFGRYELERSIDGKNYFPIGIRVAYKTDNSLEKYQYSDDLSGNADNTFFYRLKMIDQDGNYKYSNAIVIKKDDNSINIIAISPNPVKQKESLTVRTRTVFTGVVEIQITDMLGRLMLRQQNNVIAGNNSISVSGTSTLKPGLYILCINDGIRRGTAKVTVIE